jgi:hypothetical protein
VGTPLARSACMKLDLKKARELCTEAELALVSDARPAILVSLTPRLLRLKVVRARGLRDKFRDVAHRHVREARRKVAPRGKRPARGTARTFDKAELFGEVLRRFEVRAAELDLLTQRPASAAARRGRIAPTKPVARASTARPISRARAKPLTHARPKGRPRWKASDGRKASKLKSSHVPRVRSHVSSRNKRNQARRDAR